MRVMIVGNGIVANLAALYLRKRLPETAHIVIAGPESRGGMPVVGESTIEITAQFLENKLGLGQYLRRTHYPKYALTYYFKLYPDRPDDRTYSVQCNERDPIDLAPLPGWEGPTARPPSWQLNRAVFDRDMQRFVDEADGIERIHATATGVALDGAGHTVTLRDEDGRESDHATDWLVDATGRRQLLGRHLGSVRRSTPQRDCFWFRLSGFDRDILKEVDALGPMPAAEGEPYHYDRYYSTHHFMGRGSWIWCIPLRSPDQELISIGLSMRPDVYPHSVRNIDDFLEFVGREHPVVADLVRSGTVEDTNTFNNYRYELEQVYSADRWCAVGDAAVSVDPLFSNGLAFGAIQLEQVGEMIAADGEGNHSPAYIDQLEKAFWAPVRTSQATIGKWYEEMHDPILSAVRLNMIEVSYFYILLPLVVNRCHYDPEWMQFWKILQFNSKPVEVPPKLAELRARIDHVEPGHFVYHGKEKVNLSALKRCADPEALKEQLQAGGALLKRYFAEVAAQLSPQASSSSARE